MSERTIGHSLQVLLYRRFAENSARARALRGYEPSPVDARQRPHVEPRPDARARHRDRARERVLVRHSLCVGPAIAPVDDLRRVSGIHPSAARNVCHSRVRRVVRAEVLATAGVELDGGSRPTKRSHVDVPSREVRAARIVDHPVGGRASQRAARRQNEAHVSALDECWGFACASRVEVEPQDCGRRDPEPDPCSRIRGGCRRRRRRGFRRGRLPCPCATERKGIEPDDAHLFTTG